MMKYKGKIRLILLHIALICGMIILTAGILDWFNPYLNFSGQIRPIEMVQVCSLLVLAFTAGTQNSRPKYGKAGHHKKYEKAEGNR